MEKITKHLKKHWEKEGLNDGETDYVHDGRADCHRSPELTCKFNVV